jgi:signal transduction histidine kinase
VLVLVRALEVPGWPGLLAMAELPSALIAADLQPLITPPSLRVRVEDEDGVVAIVSNNQRHLLGMQLARPPEPLPANGTAVRRQVMQGDGLVFTANLATPFEGLSTVVALDEADALGGWPRLRARVITAMLGFNALILALSAVLATVVRLRHSAAVERAAASGRLEAAMNALPDGFVLWDPQDRLVTRNERHKELYAAGEEQFAPGVTFAEAARKALQLGQLALPEGEDDRAALRRLVTQHYDFGWFERQLADGRWLRVAQRPMPDGGIVGIHTEITEQKRALAELAVARDAAAAAVAAKSRLLSHVSHEMRTPLVSLLRLAEQLGAEPQLTPTQRHRVRLVEAAGRHMLALANEVLDLAALEAGRLSLHVGVVEGSPIFEEAAAMLQPVAEAKSVRIETRIDGLPPAIRADATRLRQVVLNLLSNAVKFTPEGSSVRLTVRAAAGRLVLDVTDEGAGVPPAMRDQLFVDFGKLSPAEVEGTGLGLAITGRLVELMGGSIACLDRDGGAGARFRVELPLEAAELAQLPALQETVAARLRILGVDDSPSNLAVLRACSRPPASRWKRSPAAPTRWRRCKPPHGPAGRSTSC